jgi:putative membrane protein
MTNNNPNQENNGRKINLTNELARERNRAAAERTLMAWIRTSLSLITFGFGIDKILSALQKTRLEGSSTLNVTTRLVGISFILLGIGALTAAVIEHRKSLRMIVRDDYTYSPPHSVGLTTAISLISIGVFAFFVVILGTV